MATPQSATQKSRLPEPSVLSEIVTGTVLGLWIVYVEISRLDPYFAAEIGIVLYMVFMFSVFYKNYVDKKFALATQDREQKAQLATLQAELQAKNSELFTREVQARSSIQGEILQIRRYALETVVQMLTEALQDGSLSPEKKLAYADIAKRVRDMERSLWQSYEELTFRGPVPPRSSP